MKKLTPHPVFIVLASALFFLFAFKVLAQDPLSQNQVKYCTSAEAGKTVVTAADGKQITETVTLQTGARLTTDGNVIWKDGSKTKLDKGDCVGIDEQGSMYVAKAKSAPKESAAPGMTSNK